MGTRALRLVGLCLIALGLIGVPASATPPGQNGKIAYSDGGDIWLMNPDGTGKTQLTSGPETDFDPDWSPDGTQIAFTRSTASVLRIYVMDADGNDPQLIATNARAPSWSPDGTRIAYVGVTNNQPRIWTVNADGSNPSDLTITGPYDPPEEELDPQWSPDSAEIAYNAQYCLREACVDYVSVAEVVPAAGGSKRTLSDGSALDWTPDSAYLLWAAQYGDEIDKISRDGQSFQFISFGAFGRGSWSPDGSRIVVDDYSHTPPVQILIMDSDGGNQSTLGAGREPDWQSTPINAYPRPKGASPTDVPLVPAYEPCTSPNRTHGPPLAFPACAPPQQKPGQLTVGTPDANGQPAKLRANIRINPLRGLPSTPQDEADVRLRATVNDVRLRSDLSDYTGDLEVRLTVQITDKDNTPHPGGPGAATVQEFTHSHPLPCSTTPADTTVGSLCQFDTTIEAVVPGAVKELTRGIWELRRITVHDAAGNLFLTQGIFVP